MRYKTCNYCKKYERSNHESDKCKPCEQELRAIVQKITEKYSQGLNNLAQK